jgi:hypothetical protein
VAYIFGVTPLGQEDAWSPNSMICKVFVTRTRDYVTVWNSRILKKKIFFQGSIFLKILEIIWERFSASLNYTLFRQGETMYIWTCLPVLWQIIIQVSFGTLLLVLYIFTIILFMWKKMFSPEDFLKRIMVKMDMSFWLILQIICINQLFKYMCNLYCFPAN